MDEQEINRAIKGLTRRPKIKLEHLQIIEDNLGEDKKEFWQEFWAKNNNIKLALTEKIYTSEMVRLLTLRSLTLPKTRLEMSVWYKKGKEQHREISIIFDNFKEQFFTLTKEKQHIFKHLNNNFIDLDKIINYQKIKRQKKRENTKKFLNFCWDIFYTAIIFIFIILSITFASIRLFELKITHIGDGVPNPAKIANDNYEAGNYELEKENYYIAINYYNNAINFDPQLVNAYFNRGNAYFYLEEYSNSLEDYNKVIDLDPEYANAYFNRGTVYYNLEDYDYAIDSYEKASYLYLQQEKYEEYQESLQQIEILKSAQIIPYSW